MGNEPRGRRGRRGLTRRQALALTGAALAVVSARATRAGADKVVARSRARISIRVGVGLWLEPARCDDVLALVKEYRDVVDEVAFFTSLTHPPLPRAVIEERAGRLAEILPRFRALGVSAGINHLSTIGHHDENLDNSLREPWQHLVGEDGTVSRSCYCAADPQVREYIRACYVALAKARPDFLWIDDVRLEGHGPVRFSCFCNPCVAAFSRDVGQTWTRETLVAALRGGSRDHRLALRKQWLAHNRAYLDAILATVRAAVDEVDARLPLGLMTGETAYGGYGFREFVPTLAGKAHNPVKWRPGGGFYTDDTPLALLDKAHSVGRQAGLLPRELTEIQYEHENFPYQRLKKSVTTFTAEIAAAIGAGCTGAALNCLGIASDPPDEFRAYLDGVRAWRPFVDEAVATLGRSPCEGVWGAFTTDRFAALQPDGDWFAASPWGGGNGYLNELAEIGIPLAYTREAARVTALSGDGVLEFSRDELRKILSGGVLLDVAALQRLHELGLGEHAGFAPREVRDRDTLERFTSDPLNGRSAGLLRDCRPSFYPEPASRIEPTSSRARVLSELVDFTPRSFGPTSGVFENSLGGRVAVVGYYPWRSLQSLAKTHQMKAICRWLSNGTLPAYVSSYTKAALWCRRDARGRLSLLLLNASSDPLARATLQVREAERLEAVRRADRLVVTGLSGKDGGYATFTLPALGGWEPLLLRSV
jgi:hypothetical protein